MEAKKQEARQEPREAKPPQEQQQRPAKRKVGQNLLGDMLARGATELAFGLGVQGHDYAHIHRGSTIHDHGR